MSLNRNYPQRNVRGESMLHRMIGTATTEIYESARQITLPTKLTLVTIELMISLHKLGIF